jgi:hypothetical protein
MSADLASQPPPGLMLFFKRILGDSTPEIPSDRRGGPRYPIGPSFPLKVVLNTVGRDEMGLPLQSKDGAGWDWTGRLINLSPTGARMQVPATMHAHKDDACRMKFEIEGYELVVPGRIAHITERRDSFVYGIQLDTSEPDVGKPYRQLFELIALGAGLKPTKPSHPDESGYLLEQYAAEEFSSLEVWRAGSDQAVVAFNLRLNDCHVRGLAGEKDLQFLLNVAGEKPVAAPPEQRTEMQRLFHWVVPNLSPDVPEDVRAFLQKHAA